MIALAARIGRERAHEKMIKLSRQAAQRETDLLRVLREDDEITGVLDDEDLQRLLDPANYLGESGEIVDSVIKRRTESERRAGLTGRGPTDDGPAAAP